MKKILTAALGAAAVTASLWGAGTASADNYQDSQFVLCIGEHGLWHRDGPSGQAAAGREIAGHITSGLRDPLQERNWIYHNTDSSVTWLGANVPVNCATDIYLGFGPQHGTTIDGRLA